MAIRSTIPRRRRGERPEPISALNLVLGYGPVGVLPLIAIVAAALPPKPAYGTLLIGQFWGAAILIFIAGVRRGLSFARAGESLREQVGAALGLFAFGFGALIAPIGPAFLLLILGYALAGILDRRAARVGTAPVFFARLRPIQAVVAVAGLGAMLGRLLIF